MTPEFKARIEQIRRGRVPEGWEPVPLGSLGTAKNGLNYDRESTGFIIKILGVGDFRDKSVLTDVSSLQAVSLSARPDSDYFLKDGDIVFVRSNGSRELVGRNLLVYPSINPVTYSGFCIRFRITPGVNTTPEYINLFLDNGVLKRQLIKENQGSNINNLNQDILRKLVILLPPIREQQKIAEILTTQDKVIELKENLLTEKQRQKKYLMQQLLTGKKRLPGFNKAWGTVELGEIFDYIQPTAYLVKTTDYDNAYKTPVLTAGKTFILGYTDETQGVFTEVPVVIFDDFTTATKYVDFPFKAKSSAMKILTIKDGFSIFFSYEAMQLIKFMAGGHERHWISKYSFITIDIPEIEEQNAIAEALSTADRELDLLRQDIEQEKQKKTALMQLLLTGIVRVSI